MVRRCSCCGRNTGLSAPAAPTPLPAHAAGLEVSPSPSGALQEQHTDNMPGAASAVVTS